MEENLFEWSAWDYIDDAILQFYGCVLKEPIGKFKPGDTVPIIVVDFENGVLQLLEKGRAVLDEQELISEHKVRMVIAD